MASGQVFGGRGNAWTYGAVVKGKVMDAAEEIDVDALEELLEELAEEHGINVLAVLPIDDIADAEEGFELVVGIPVLTAVIDDDNTSEEATADADPDALAEALEDSVPEDAFLRIAEELDLEQDQEADPEDLWLAPGGWAEVRLAVGDDESVAFSENSPAAILVELPEDTPAKIIVTPA